MEYTNYIKINKDNLNYNLNHFNNKYNYEYILLDVSNNAYSHGMYLIKYLPNNIYLYINNFNDVILARKYNKNISIIYGGEITLDNVYDLLINNVILLLKSNFILKKIKTSDNINIMLNIDINGYDGLNTKQEIEEINNIINNNPNINLLGIIAKIKEEDYLEFRDLISDLNNLKLIILNNEEDKKKIKLSNGIKLNLSIYGINKTSNKKLFKKEEPKEFKQVFTLKSHIIKINTITLKKKEILLGVIPFGSLNGLNNYITHVAIHQNLYKIYEINPEYTLIEIDKNINILDTVEITSNNNPLEDYFKENTLNYFNLFNNLPIIYEDYTLEKTFIY